MSTAPTEFDALPEGPSPSSGEPDPSPSVPPEAASEHESPPEIPDLLDRLRNRTERLAEEVRRLRAENRRMRARIAELEEVVESSGTLLPLDAEPDELREQIDRFIDVVDERLARAQNVEEPSS